MTTVVKERKPLSEISRSEENVLDDDSITVEQFLEKQFDNILTDFRSHCEELITTLKQEYQDGVRSIKDIMATTTSSDKLVVTLKCIAGPHIGQKFRIEPSTDNSNENVFKMGRSTGKAFREKGVSLYKDKEISTTHAKIELRNGQAFIVDSKSTNGTILNNVEMEALHPLRLQDGDIIAMGSTELLVRITTLSEEQLQAQLLQQQTENSPKSY